jgi:hypothetical protein
MRTQGEERRIVVSDERRAFVVVEREPGAGLAAVAVENAVGHLRLPPSEGVSGLGEVALDEVGIAVDGGEEVVQGVLAHAGTPFGYQVK